VIATLDPNTRPGLIDDPDDYRNGIVELAANADLVKLSVEDAEFVFPGSSASEAARRLGGGGATVVMTAASQPTMVSFGGEEWREPVRIDATAVDPTGAGDSLMAALLTTICLDGLPADREGWTQAVIRGHAAAQLTCSRYGGAESMPQAGELAS
jgi:fructokinase